MKTRMNLKPQTTVKTSTTLIWKIAAGVGALGIVVASVFFAISYFGTPKDSLAGGDDHNNYTIPTEKNIIISEYGSKGHDETVAREINKKNVDIILVIK